MSLCAACVPGCQQLQHIVVYLILMCVREISEVALFTKVCVKLFRASLSWEIAPTCKFVVLWQTFTFSLFAQNINSLVESV